MNVLKAMVFSFVFFLTLSLTAKANEQAKKNVRKQKFSGITFFVAANGNDAWSGRYAVVNNNDGPFATLERARDAIREIKQRQKDFSEPITVMIREGKYYLKETFVLDDRDSGKENSPVTWRGYPGEKATISGGRKITDWKTYKDKILQVKLPEVKSGSWNFRQLFFNGKRQIRSRTPNYDPDNPLYGGWAIMQGCGDKYGASVDAFKYPSDLFKTNVKKPSLANVFFFRHGSHASSTNYRASVTSIDSEKQLIYTEYGPDNPNLRFGTNNRFIVENVLEELDQPGEWCLDWEEGVLYFWPPSDICEKTEIVAPVLYNLFELNETSWIVISDLTFTETANNWPKNDYKEYYFSSIFLRNAKNCLITDSVFYSVGHSAINLMGRPGECVSNTIQNNEVSFAGGWGFWFIGNVRDNIVRNNDIHHCGVINKRASGIELSGGREKGRGPDRNLIAHNYVHDLPRDGIHLGISPYGRNIVEYNLVQRTALETLDNGGIRSHGFNVGIIDDLVSTVKNTQMDGHVIRYNMVIDPQGCGVSGGKIITPYKWPSFGVYLDEGASNCLLYGNIIVRAGIGIHMNPGKAHLLENNIFVDSRMSDICFQFTHHLFETRELMTDNRFVRNIFYTTKSTKSSVFTLYDGKHTVKEVDYNLFHAPSGNGTMAHLSKGPDVWADTTKYSAADWKSRGYDLNSLTADPLFLDPDNYNYQLRPDSPALRLGFVPIDISKIGIRTRNKDKSFVSEILSQNH